eukprot:5600830-Heterocapsa_arctica.AAC.1
MEAYGLQMQQANEAEMGYSRKAYPWTAEACKMEVDEVSLKELRTELKQDMVQAKQADCAGLCHCCRLPLGKLVYSDEQDKPVHGECLAQHILLEAKAEQDARQEKEAAIKRQRRVQYDIGFKIQQVPSNLGPLGKLGFREIPEGAAVCL